MKAVLSLEDASTLSNRIKAKKYFRMRLINGQIAGTVSSNDEMDDRVRDLLVRVSSYVSKRQGEEKECKALT